MEVYEQYIYSLKDHINDYNIDISDDIKYDSFNIDIKYETPDNELKLLSSTIELPKSDNDIILDSFDIEFTYYNSLGDSCNVKVVDLIKKEFPSLHDIFNRKKDEFKKCYEKLAEKYKVYDDTWVYSGGSATIALTGNFIVSESNEYLVSENGEFIIF